MQDRATIDFHTTSRGDPRIKVRYSSKPSQSTLDFLRMNEKFRKGTSGTPPAWYIDCDAACLRGKAITGRCTSLLEAIDNMAAADSELCYHTPLPSHSGSGPFSVVIKAPEAAVQSAASFKRLCMADRHTARQLQRCPACEWENCLAAKDAHLRYSEPHIMYGVCWYS